MSFMKRLVKVAIGIAAVKGVGAVMNRNRQSGAQAGNTQTGTSQGGLLGGLTGGADQSGGLQGMLGGVLGGSAAGVGTGGLGGLLEKLGGGPSGIANNPNFGGLLGGAAGGGLFAGLAGALNSAPEKNNDSFGAVLNSQFDETPQPPVTPSRAQEATAALMLSAMIQAAKSDGTFDAAERDKILGHAGEMDAEEEAFIRAQLEASIDVDALVANTPEGMGAQVYTMSLLAIDLDTKAEAEHLHKLATGYGMSPQQVNEIHAELGVPSLYT